MERTCGYCGESLAMRRADARYCNAHCRVYAARAAKRNSLPAEMTSRDRWMRWERVDRRGKISKRPVTTSGRQASSTNADTWSTHAEASKSTVGAGLGFALGDGIGCIDLDHCITDGEVAAWAQEILDRTPATFIEVSQSGEGLHIFGLMPESPGRNIRRDGVNVEFYSAGRFIAMTGNRFGKSPSTLADLSEVIASVS